MPSITQALAETFHEAIEQSAHKVITNPDDWQAFQKTQQSFRVQEDECRRRFDEEFNERVSAEVIRLSLRGPSLDINGPDGAPAGETLEQRAQRNVMNVHQIEMDQIQEARTYALATVLETARTQQDASLGSKPNHCIDLRYQIRFKISN